MIWMILGLACAGSGDDTGAAGMGTLSSDIGESAVVGDVGFGFNSATNGMLAMFFPGNTAATCDEVAASLSGEQLDPTGITPGGTCSTFFYAEYGAPGPTTWTALPATLVMNCAMGEGTWAETGGCDGGYCYSGHFWTGAPESFEVTVSGGDGEDFGWALTSAGGDGQYPYETLDAVTLDGDVAGTGSAAFCEGIGETLYF